MKNYACNGRSIKMKVLVNPIQEALIKIMLLLIKVSN